MGNCNGSKSQDIDASRRRAPAADKNQAPQKTTTKPIGAPSAVPQPANVAESYSEKRVEESDILKNLVEKTSQNLIDVSQSTAVLDARTTENRKKDYREREAVRSALTAPAQPVAPLCAFTAPVPSKENASPAELLSTKPRDQESLAKHASNLHGVVKKMRIQDCGDLVVPFGSLAGAT